MSDDPEKQICPEHKTEPRKEQNAAGVWVVKHQCVLCGWSSGQQVSKASTGKRLEDLEQFDRKALSEHRARLSGAWQEINSKRMQEIEQRRMDEREAWFREHDDYLRTDKWRSLRQRVISRCNNLCEGCRMRTVSEVHHMTYDHWKDELLYELVGLCHGCHMRAHSTRNR